MPFDRVEVEFDNVYVGSIAYGQDKEQGFIEFFQAPY